MATEKEEIDLRVRIKAERGEFLGQLLAVSRNQSVNIHDDFIRKLTDVATSLRTVFQDEGLIRGFKRSATDFWGANAGKRVAFVDGGVARVDLPSAAPMGIRVGSYSVLLGEESSERERFSPELTLVDELYSEDSWTFQDVFDDIQKMTDAARIISEAAGVLKTLCTQPDLAAVFLHGPLINPVAPYGAPGFPAFSTSAARVFLHDRVQEFTDDEHHFVPLYRRVLQELASMKKPVIGVVERSLSQNPTMLLAHVDALQKKGVLSAADAKRIDQDLSQYRLSDVATLSVMLATGEYTTPILIDRQQPSNKWPDNWRTYIGDYPKANTTYLKSSDNSDPFRLEMQEGVEVGDECIEMVYQTAKLLPQYGFPVGLDIADKFAKVPNWMSAGIRQEHAVALLKKALKSNEPNVIAFAKRVLAAKGRDWLFRPKA